MGRIKPEATLDTAAERAGKEVAAATQFTARTHSSMDSSDSH
jgi:hypothetical protein